MKTAAEIYAEHNAPLVEGVSAPPATAADACQCTDCRAHVAGTDYVAHLQAAAEPTTGDPA